MSGEQPGLGGPGSRYGAGGESGVSEPIIESEPASEPGLGSEPGMTEAAAELDPDDEPGEESTRGDAALFGVCAGLGGLALGVIGTATQQLTVGQQSFGSVSGFPIGLLVPVIGVGCFVIGTRLASRSRWNALIASICVIIPIAVLSLKSRGGSVLVPNNWVGQVWEYGPALLCLLAVLWPKLPPRTKTPIAKPIPVLATPTATAAAETEPPQPSVQ